METRRGLAVGLVLTVTMFAFEALGVATVLPSARDELGGLWLYGWAFSAFTLADLLGITVAGRWADRRGPASPYSVGMVLFAAGLVVAGAAPSMPALVLGRAVQGLGAGAVASVVYVSLGRTFDDAGRARMLAWLSTAWVLPGLVGPAISGAVAEHLTWRLAFIGILPVLGIATVLTLPSLRRLGPPPEPATHDEASPTAGAVRLVIGAGLALSGLGNPNPVVAIALFGAGLAIGVPALSRLLPPGTLRAAAGLPAAVATRGLLTFAYFGAQAFLTLALTDVRGQSLTAAGLTLTATTVAWTLGAWVQERRGLVWGWHRMVPAGFVLLAVGVAGLGLALLPSVPIAVAALAWAGAGFGMGIAFQSGTLMTLAAATPGREGSTSAGLQLADVLGVSLGAGVGGAAVGLGERAGWEPRAGIALAFAACFVTAVLGIAASRHLPRRTTSDPAVPVP
ncbi:MAG TPA: MFS transporter [Acidimicrobiales bacterium]|nr:MFS transporter [Acidimicrobiales bacterium]